ncbi:hypothetical protein Pint_35895 [Pistacia integerrima]|uniref:Uncharacterized protein n=1 Tax=Pistacia integerrima TaxID=434235 RepID=A0ACC0Y453_9ROSI|nr:hypothetical protein Pint_35895 [Pistacia integerrima]
MLLLMVAVSRTYIWAYASFQFAIVILFAHIFYSVGMGGGIGLLTCCNMQLNVNPILSVLLSSFTGFGLAISTNSLIVEYLRWRTSRQMQSPHWQINIVQQQLHELQQLEQQNQQSQQQEYQQHQHQQTEAPSVGSINSSRR